MVAWVQNISAKSPPSTTGAILSTAVLTFDHIFTAGHGAAGQIQVFSSGGGTWTAISISSVQDNLGNTWTPLDTVAEQPGVLASLTFGVASVPNAPTSVTLTFSITGGVAGQWDSFCILDEISAASAITGHALAFNNAGTAWSSGTAVVSVGDLVTGFGIPSGGALTAGSGFTFGLNDTTNGYFSEWKIATSTSEAALFTGTSGNSSSIGMIAFSPAVTDVLLGQIML